MATLKYDYWKFINPILLISLIGLFFKMASIPGAFLFVLGFGCLSIIFILILLNTIFEKGKDLFFKIIISYLCFLLSICFFTILCRYKWWQIGYIIPAYATVSFVIISIVIIIKLKLLLSQEITRIYFYRFLPAWVIVFLLGIIPFILTQNQFYNTFHAKSKIEIEK
jgi:hypothetical protein